MTVPTEAPLNVEATHVRPASDDILDRTGENVAVVGQASSKGGSIIERVSANQTD